MIVKESHKILVAFFCGFLICLLIFIGGGFVFYKFYAMPRINEARAQIGSLPPPIPVPAMAAGLKGKWTSARGEVVDAGGLNGEVIVLNIWATWGQPCVVELPSLLTLSRRFAACKDVRVICLSTESMAVIKKWLPNQEMSELLCSSSESELAEVCTPKTIPTTLLINKQGKIVFRHTGIANWGSDEVASYVESLRKD